MLERLINAAMKEATKETKETAAYIRKGYRPTWGEEYRNNPDRGIEEYSTATKWNAYKNNEITRSQAIEKAIERATKQLDKKHAATIEKIKAVSAAPALTDITILVEWHKSPTWGYNPTATVTINNKERYTGTASGCGYDKESAAIAQALNQSETVLKFLYTIKDKHTAQNNRTCIGYGSGYGLLPAFEGGTGFSCFDSIFRKFGLVSTSIINSEKTTVYTYTTKARRAAR